MSKAEKAKLPKTIGGVKIPKALRDAGWLEEIVTRPEGRAVLALAIMKAAEAAAAVLLEDRTDAPDEETDPAMADVPMVEILPDLADSIAVAPAKPRGRRRKAAGADPATGEPDQAASAGS